MKEKEKEKEKQKRAMEKEKERNKSPLQKEKKRKKREGRQGDPAALTYPRKESKFGSGPPCFQNGDEESPAHQHKKGKEKVRTSVSP